MGAGLSLREDDEPKVSLMQSGHSVQLSLMGYRFGGPGRTRTFDQWIMSPIQSLEDFTKALYL